MPLHDATLHDVVVLELTTGIAGPYAGKLFADAGAHVIKVEPPGGDPERHRAPDGVDLQGADSALFQHLNAGKHSVLGCPGDAEVELLASRADLVIESSSPADPVVERWRAERPELVVLSITPFGRRGPWQDRPATTFTLQAESGSIGSRGRHDQPPVQAGGRLSEWAAGVFGAVGALAAVLRSRATGQGEHVDCSQFASDHMITNGNVCVRDSVRGHPAPTLPARIVDVPSIEPTADGYIGFNTNTRQQVEAFLAMVGCPDLLQQEPRWASAEYRLLHAQEFYDHVRPWIRARTTAQVMALAAAARIPVAPVNNGESLLAQEQFVSQGALDRLPGSNIVHPTPPYRIDGERPTVRHPAPQLGAGAGDVPPAPERGRHRGATSTLPLAGLRVLDATSMWAGPVVGQLCAALGADVIHLESVQRLDLSRLKVDNASQAPLWWERGHTWLMVNFNKRDLTLDLTSERGHQLVEALLPTCDVLVENYSPRVFEKFGLTTERVQAVNPELIFARMPAFGLHGPWRDYIGFAQTMEQMSGLAWLTGHVDGGPQVPRGPCDPLAGYHAMFAVLVAVARRSQGHGGAMIEAAMAESAVNAAAESVVDFSAYGVVLERTGNRSADAAPQGLYETGPERWIALSVQDDEQWTSLKAALGEPARAQEARLDNAAGRGAEHDTLDKHLGAWAAGQDPDDAVAVLVAHGVPAGQVSDPRLVDAHPQLVGCGYLEPVEHPVLGTHRVPTLPFRYAGVERWIRSPAPALGQHNEEILGGLLGLDAAELDRLRAAGVIGTEPLASNPSFDM